MGTEVAAEHHQYVTGLGRESDRGRYSQWPSGAGMLCPEITLSAGPGMVASLLGKKVSCISLLSYDGVHMPLIEFSFNTKHQSLFEACSTC